jgi:hypothetical protein
MTPHAADERPRHRSRGQSGEERHSACLARQFAGLVFAFRPTTEQTPFNNRRRIKVRPDGKYAFRSKMPNGYSVPPGGATDVLMQALGRHGSRPAHVHFFIEAPGFRTLTTQINFGDDPFAQDDFAFGTREGLLPVPNRQGDTAHRLRFCPPARARQGGAFLHPRPR